MESRRFSSRSETDELGIFGNIMAIYGSVLIVTAGIVFMILASRCLYEMYCDMYEYNPADAILNFQLTPWLWLHSLVSLVFRGLYQFRLI